MAKKNGDGAGTATVDKPARTRKSPKDRAETLTVRVINALRKLGELGGKLSALTTRSGMTTWDVAGYHATRPSGKTGPDKVPRSGIT